MGDEQISEFKTLLHLIILLYGGSYGKDPPIETKFYLKSSKLFKVI